MKMEKQPVSGEDESGCLRSLALPTEDNERPLEGSAGEDPHHKVYENWICATLLLASLIGTYTFFGVLSRSSGRGGRVLWCFWRFGLD